MKKKILLVLLVVLMVGILAFSVFACNGGDDDKKKPDKTPIEEPDDEIEDVDYLTPMVTDVIGALDNTIANVTKIDNKASVSASIYVDVAVGEETYKVNLDIAGSIDQTAKAKNWAQIDANVLGVEVSLFAVNNGEVEDLYIAQNILNEEKQWNKLSQFEQANVLNNLACNSIIDLVKGIDETTKKQLSDGYINGVAGGILGMLSIVDGMNILVPGAGAGEDFATADGYNAALNVGGIAALLEMDFVAELLVKLPADYHGIISMAIDLLLGADLKFVTDEETGAVSATFTPGTAENTPTIELGFAVEDDLFTGLALSYAKGDISIQFGINNISLSADSKAYNAPYGSTEPDELAIALDLDLTVPGIVEDVVSAEINVYPNVKMTFDQQGYVALDLSGLYAYATADIAGENYTIAEYNMNPDYPEDLFIDLTPIINALNDAASANLSTGVYPINDITVFRVPVDLQSKFDKMIADEKAKKNTSSNAAQNAINGKNVVDYVIEDIVPGLFNEDGSFNIGAIVGVLGQVGAIVEELTPILETEGLFDAAIEGSTASATLNLEVLIDALLNDSDIITGITGEWNSFDLYNADGTKAEDMTLASILAEENVLGNIVALVNTLIYENYAKNVAEGETALSYADFFASEYAPTQLTENMVILSLKQLAGATVTADEFYTGLEATVSGYAQNGIGAALEVAIADGKLGIGIGARIIDNVAKTEETVPSIYYMGDQNGYAYVDQYQSEISASTKVSSNTGYDGGKLLAETLILMARSACAITEAYLDQSIYGIAAEGGTYETAVATTTGGEFQCPRAFGEGAFYIAVTTNGAATITLTCDAEMQAVQYAGIAELNPRNQQYAVMNPVVGLCGEYNEETQETAYVASGVIEVAEAGTYVILVQYYGAPVVGVAIA